MNSGVGRTKSLIACGALAIILETGCGTEQSSNVNGTREESQFSPGPAVTDVNDAEWFTERAVESGLDFTHFNGAAGQVYFPEIMTGGVGLFDYDNDGDLDAYLVQGQMLGESSGTSEALFPPPGPLPLKGSLYRNDLTLQRDGSRLLRFTDVTDESRLEVDGYGMGVAAGDIDNDGWVDLYLTHYGPNQLFRNNGDGTFADISQQSGTDDPQWSVSAAFVDYDRDGWLDLYVANYVSYNVDTSRTCTTSAGAPDYCSPQVYPSQPDRLYRNRGDGTFADVTATALVGGEFGPGLGVATADFNGDGWLDIYVANDGEENQLWLNQRDGRFRNDGVLSGVSVNAEGQREAGMGVVAGDLDGDGDEDLFVTHLSSETNTVYLNDGTGLFADRSAVSGLGPPSLISTGFGTAWIDIDNDGRLDNLVVNGAVGVIRNWLPPESRSLVQGVEERNEVYPYGQPNQLFRNVGDVRFEDVTSRAGETFGLPEVSRGAAVGDVDNDGDVDVVVTNTNGPVRLFLNDIGNRNHWLGLSLVGTASVGARNMLGARVEVKQANGPTLWRRVHTDGSYASTNDPRVLFGLGSTSESVSVRVLWPDGREETWPDVAIDRWVSLQQGATP